MEELKLSRGLRHEVVDVRVVRSGKESEEVEEEEEEEEEARTRKRKVRKPTAGGARALQPLDINQQHKGRAHRRLRHAL